MQTPEDFWGGTTAYQLPFVPEEVFRTPLWAHPLLVIEIPSNVEVHAATVLSDQKFLLIAKAFLKKTQVNHCLGPLYLLSDSKAYSNKFNLYQCDDQTKYTQEY